MYKRILLGYDGSESGQQALLDSREIAQWSQAELLLVAVMPLPITALGPEGGVYDETLEREERARYQAILDAGVQRLAQAGLSARGEVLKGDPVHELARAAERLKADLIGLVLQHLALDVGPLVGREHLRDLVQRKTGRLAQRDQRQQLQHARVEGAAQALTADRGDQPLLFVIAQRRGRQARASGDFCNVHDSKMP